MNLRDTHFETRSLQHFQRCPARVRMKIIVKCVRPQNYFAFFRRRNRRGFGSVSDARNAIFSGPLLESGTGEPRYTALRGQVQSALNDLAKARRLTKKISNERSNRSEFRPTVDHPEGIRVQRAALALLIMSKKL